MNTVTLIVLLLFGMGLGYLLRYYLMQASSSRGEIDGKRIRINAEEEAQTIIREASEKAEKTIDEARSIATKREDEAKELTDRLAKREEFIDTRQRDLDRDIEKLKTSTIEVAEIRTKATEALESRTKELERVASLSREDARDEVIKLAEQQHAEDIKIKLRKLEESGTERFQSHARDILLSVIQRLASSTASDTTTTLVHIPNEEIKGKIIGKEGRNIKCFERAAGVELIVDDTPNGIIVSSFDPVRRQVARLALENLILDGRIQPAKIEEFVEKSKADINTIIKEKGEQAVHELGIYNFDPRLIAIVGRLFFRTSYGQNVLQHSIEMAHLAEMLAYEVGADPYIAKCGALVHDIGKALDHEVEGSHVVIGMKILEKFNADPRVITAMKSHHDDWPHETPEAVIVQVCDMISGSRPGARRDSLENYLKRLGDLEAVATGFDGVAAAYALSAGREIRVFVKPQDVDDFAARIMARNIADKISEELRFPGEIKVTLIRENRVIEFAR
jgi:ribonuclease Y